MISMTSSHYFLYSLCSLCHCVHCSLFIVHCSLFIVHCSLFIVHCFVVYCCLLSFICLYVVYKLFICSSSWKSSYILALVSLIRCAEFCFALTYIKFSKERWFVPVDEFFGGLELILQVYGISLIGKEHLAAVCEERESRRRKRGGDCRRRMNEDAMSSLLCC